MDVKPDIKVLIVVGPQNSGSTASKVVHSDGETTYTGFTYDIWTLIKNQLKDSYNFKEYYSHKDEVNYDKFVKKTHDGKYDLVVGNFTQTPQREKLVNFTNPILIDCTSILHVSSKSNLERFIFVIKNNFKYLLILFIVGILLGFVLYFSESKRSTIVPHVKTFKKKGEYTSLRRTILTTIAALFGEMGFLAENSTLSMYGLIATIGIIMIAFLLIMYIQAEITAENIEKRSMEKFTKENLKHLKLIGFKGYASVDKVKRFWSKCKGNLKI